MDLLVFRVTKGIRVTKGGKVPEYKALRATRETKVLLVRPGHKVPRVTKGGRGIRETKGIRDGRGSKEMLD